MSEADSGGDALVSVAAAVCVGGCRLTEVKCRMRLTEATVLAVCVSGGTLMEGDRQCLLSVSVDGNRCDGTVDGG